MKKQKTFLKDSIVAFVDILGFREGSSKTDSESATKNLLFLMEFENAANYIKNRELELSCIETSIFSDSIVISININNEESEDIALFYIAAAVQEIAIKSHLYGYLIRGAITKGLLHHESGIAFGPALVEAVEMEGKLAIYPRIIVADDVSISTKLNNQFNLFKHSDDGFLYLDYLNGFHLLPPKKSIPLIKKKISKAINQNLAFFEEESSSLLKKTPISILRKRAKWKWFEAAFLASEKNNKPLKKRLTKTDIVKPPPR